MSLPILEASVDSAQPVELWRFLITPEPQPSELVTPDEVTPGSFSNEAFDRDVTGSIVGNTIHVDIEAQWGGGLGDPPGARYFYCNFVLDPTHTYYVTSNRSVVATVSEDGPPEDFGEVIVYGINAGLWTAPYGTIPSGFGIGEGSFSAFISETMQRVIVSGIAGIQVRLGLYGLPVDLQYPIFTTVGTAYVIDMGLTSELEEAEAGTPMNYAEADESITFMDEVYAPAVFSRTPFRSGDGESNEEVELSMPRDHPLAQLFHQGMPVAAVTATCYRVHRQDALASVSFTVPFIGQVAQARIKGSTCTFLLQTMRGLLDRKRPSMLVTGKCSNMLYDRQCQIDPNLHAYPATVVSITGFTIELDGIPTPGDIDPLRFTFGFFVAPSGQRLFIAEQSAGIVQVLDAPIHLEVDDEVTVYEGCDRTPEVCHTRFSNVQHMNARALMPNRNAFGPTGMIV